MNVGFGIRKVRLEAQLSQEDLAAMAGINRTYLSQLENGRSSPTFDIIEKIAQALKISPVELIARSQTAREPEPHYETELETPLYAGLQEFLNDERFRLLMHPTAAEIEMLQSVRFLNRFSPSKELFVEILLDFRRRRKDLPENDDDELSS